MTDIIQMFLHFFCCISPLIPHSLEMYLCFSFLLNTVCCVLCSGFHSLHLILTKNVVLNSVANCSSLVVSFSSYLCLHLSPFGVSLTWLPFLSCTSSQTWSRSACPSNFQLLVLPLFSGWILIIWFVVSVILYQFLYSLCFDLIGFVIVGCWSLRSLFLFLSANTLSYICIPVRRRARALSVHPKLWIKGKEAQPPHWFRALAAQTVHAPFGEQVYKYMTKY